MKKRTRLSEDEWLNLLENAIKDGVKIQVNHRLKYKGYNLGTFLTGVKSKNKIELIKKIEKLGLNFKMHSQKPEDYIEKFIFQLSTDKEPIKQKYITRFNQYVFPKKELLDEKTINEVNSVWKAKFGDVRKWKKPDTDLDKVRKWKEFRYNIDKNPEEKWFHYKKNMGHIYGWVYSRKNSKQKMSKILILFDKKERLELKKEGFLL